ncbi:Aryl-alcohol dehydrogenase [Exophiala dermatitidis]
MTVVSERSVVRCRYEDNLDIYSALGCGFQTGAGTILNALKPGPGDAVAILGLGSVGMAAIMAAQSIGVQTIVAVDIAQAKVDLAKELGATHGINPTTVSDFAAEVFNVTGRGVDYLVECTGAVQVLESMMNCLSPRGTAAVVGVCPIGYELKLDCMKMLLESKTIKGVVQGDSIAQKFIPKMMEMHRSGRFPIQKLCKIYPVEDFEIALEDIRKGKVVKAIFAWNLP